MYKRWQSEGFTLILMMSAVTRLMLHRDGRPVMTKTYENGSERTAEVEAEQVAELGRMTLVEVETWR